MNEKFKKVVKVVIPKYLLYKNKFNALMYSFSIVKNRYKNEILFKDFKIKDGNYITFFDYDDKNLKVDYFKNGVSVYYYNKIDEKIPPLIN